MRNSIETSVVTTGASSLGCPMELTILMPCLNERETLAVCIDKAKEFFASFKIEGEVLIADNGSTDGSIEIAETHGARVTHVPVRGYGAALSRGIAAARGRFVIMGDSDDSYDFQRLGNFVEKLRQGYDLVMGNRFKGGIAPGAMPFLHRYLGNPVLSFIGRLFFNIPIGDFHCGLRGFNRDSMLSLELNTRGMEFASEMVVKAALAGYRIAEVPTTLSKDGRSRPPHLRTWRDGWRHLRFLLIFCPRWLFFYPGIAITSIGLLLTLLALPGPVQITPSVSLDVHTVVVGCLSVLIGTQCVGFSIVARKYGALRGLLPADYRMKGLATALTLERILMLAGILLACGLAGGGYAIHVWVKAHLGPLPYGELVRVLIISGTAIALALELAFTSFLSTVLEMDMPTQ